MYSNKRFPFDVNNPIGYLIAVFLEYTTLAYFFFINACTLGLVNGAYWFATSTTEEIQYILHLINKKASTNEKQSNELKILFAEFIDVHAAIKQLSKFDWKKLFGNIKSLSILKAYFQSGKWFFSHISTHVYVTIHMEPFSNFERYVNYSREISWVYTLTDQNEQIFLDFIFRLQFQHDNVTPLSVLFLDGISALALVFVACELGQRMTDSFDRVHFTLNQFEWYSFPIEIKRMLPMIIEIAHHPVSLECFGSITCCREVFKNVGIDQTTII